MSDPMGEVHDLDSRLAELDRKLRAIQAELTPPEDDPPPESDATAQDPAAAPTGTPMRRGRSGALAEVLQHAPRPSRLGEAGLARGIAELASLQADLLASWRDALARFERALAQLTPAGAERTPVAGGILTLSAGPFASIEAVRAFELVLAALPGVEDVTVRGYEGADRALIDVRLA